MGNKPAIIIVSTCLILIGSAFVVAKMNPCLAQENTCPGAHFSKDQNVPIINYTPQAVSQAILDKKRSILFFQASWCSTCYLIEKNFQEHVSEIPSDVVIFRVNIDTEKALKAKYNVVSQDELVQIDSHENEVSHWKSSEQAVAELLAHLK